MCKVSIALLCRSVKKEVSPLLDAWMVMWYMNAESRGDTLVPASCR
jgi:hypothetical protein